MTALDAFCILMIMFVAVAAMYAIIAVLRDRPQKSHVPSDTTGSMFGKPWRMP